MAGMRLSEDPPAKGILTRGNKKRQEKDRAFKKLGEEGDFQ